MAGNAARFLATAQRNHWTLDTPVPDGRMAGKTVREVYEALLAEEGEYSQLEQQMGSGEMTLEDAINMALSSPNPESFRVPYGPFQGMGVQELIARAQQQKEYLTEAGVLAPEPKEPGMLEQAMPLLGSAGATIGGMYVADAISGQSAVNAALAESIKAQTAAAAGKAGATTAAQSAIPTVTQPAAEAATSAAPQTGGVMNAIWGSGSPVYGPAPQHSYGMLGLNPAPGTVGGSFLPALGVAAGAYTGLQQGKGLLNALKGDGMSFQEEAALALPTFGLSFAVDPIKKLFGGGHDKQFYERAGNRDAFREDSNIYSGNKIGLAGGNSWDIGNSDASYNIDLDAVNADPTKGHQVLQLDALTTALGLKGTGREQQTGELANAAWSGGDAGANINAIFKNSGRTFDELREGIRSDTSLDESARAAYLAAVDEVERFSPTAAAQLPASTSTTEVDRNAGRPTPAAASQSMALARALLPQASPGQAKPRTAKLKAFWGS